MIARFNSVLGFLLVATVIAQPALGEVITLEPLRDNTLYETPDGSRSNGAGAFLFAGKTGVPRLRRAVLAFDIAGQLPAGVTINSVTLTLQLSRKSPGAAIQTQSLHRLLADWGEGASDAGPPGGSGAASAPGDATWIHSFYDTAFWTTAGGDYDATSSATSVVDNIGPYVWSSSGMVADVQGWLDSPAGNFGWALLGDESISNGVRRYDSRENTVPANRPRLRIDYSVPIPTVSAWGFVVMLLLLLCAQRIIFTRSRRVVS